MSNIQNERFLDLAIERATGGLNDGDLREWEQLSQDAERKRESERMEIAVTAVELAFVNANHEEMPESVQKEILIAAGQFFAPVRMSNERLVEVAERPAKRPLGARAKFSWREAIAYFAAAACLALLLSGYNPLAKPPGQVAERPATPTEQLASFTASRPNDLVKVSWTPVHDEDASGEVYWSDRRQEGYMVFENLDVNDPTAEQYQLWIFDTDKEQAHPVDGGVFDVTAEGQVVVPIKPHVPVDKAVQFAVTVERPGGVTVSDRQRVPVLASVE